MTSRPSMSVAIPPEARVTAERESQTMPDDLAAFIGVRLVGMVLRTRGSSLFYQVRIGADTRPAADDLCSRIRRAGGACFVLRNRGVPG